MESYEDLTLIDGSYIAVFVVGVLIVGSIAILGIRYYLKRKSKR